MIQFTINNELGKLEGRLLYRTKEYSFDFLPESSTELMLREGDEGTTSLLIGTLQIELSIESGQLLYVWGYYPNINWKQQSLPPLLTTPASVGMVIEDNLIPGVSIPLTQVGELTTFYDPGTNWICIGDYHATSTSEHVEFATNMVLTLSKGILQAIWLHPNII